MRVLLVQPPVHRESIIAGIMEPLALETLAAALREEARAEEKHEVRVLDLRVERRRAALPALLASFRPHVVGVTGITMDYPCMLDVLSRVKQHDERIATVVGGHHATMCPQEFYLPTVDYIVRGQGITTLPWILRQVAAGTAPTTVPMAGVDVRTDGGFVAGPPPLSPADVPQPRPDRQSVARYRRRYRCQGLTWAVMTTAQGCPFRCTFCACWKVMNGKYVTRPAEDVVDELATIDERHVFLGDDHTFGDVQRAEAICDLIKAAGIKKKILAYCRADVIVAHPDLFRKWADIGLCGLTIGFEALDTATLALLNKKSTVEINEKATRILADVGIHAFAHFLVRPDYGVEDFDRIRDYILRQGITKAVMPTLTPLPGTDLRSTCQTIFPDKHQYYDLAHALIPGRLAPAEIYRQIKRVYFSCFSYERWLKARWKGLVNRFSPGRYAWHEVQTPEFYTIPITRLWLTGQLRAGKMASFLRHFA